MCSIEYVFVAVGGDYRFVDGVVADDVTVADVNANDIVLDVNDVLHLSMNNLIKASMLLAISLSLDKPIQQFPVYDVRKTLSAVE